MKRVEYGKEMKLERGSSIKSSISFENFDKQISKLILSFHNNNIFLLLFVYL